MTLGEKLQLLRRTRGLSQEQLAAELEVSRQAISKWECGDSTPDLDKLRAICTYFGVTTDYLIWESEEDAPPHTAQKKTEGADYAARRERVRTLVRTNSHWAGYLLAIIGTAMLLRILAGLVMQMIFLGVGDDGFFEVVFPSLAAAYVPYLLIYAVMIAGGLLLARWLKKKEETYDDL